MWELFDGYTRNETPFSLNHDFDDADTRILVLFYLKMYLVYVMKGTAGNKFSARIYYYYS